MLRIALLGTFHAASHMMQGVTRLSAAGRGNVGVQCYSELEAQPDGLSSVTIGLKETSPHLYAGAR